MNFTFYILRLFIIHLYSNAVITDNLTFLYANPRTLLFPLVNKKKHMGYGIVR